MISSYLNRLKIERNLTNQQLSDISGVPKSTVDRILREDNTSPSLETAAALVRALGGSLDEACDIHPASVALPAQASEDTAGNLSILRDIIDRIQNLHNTIYSQKDAAVSESMNFRTRVLFGSLLINVAFAALLIYDFTHPEIGWIQYDQLSYLQQGMAGAASVCAVWWTGFKA